jgi:SAM-dependent methyltransferase
VYNGKELSNLYKNRFAKEMLKRKNEVWREIANFMQKFVKESDTVLDIACGYGELVNNIKANKKIAVDLNEDSQLFLNEDVMFFCANINDLHSVINEGIDVAFVSNFLEHLPDKNAVRIFMDKVFDLLNHNGKFIILGPNIRYATGVYWDYFDHHVPLTHLSVAEAVMLSGFNVSLVIDRFLPYTIKSSLPTHPLLVYLYLKFPIAWKILGKQFLIVAEKK